MRQQHKTFTQQHRPKKNLLIGGIQSIIDAMKNGEQLERIYLQNSISSPEAEELKRTALEFEIPVNKVPFEKIRNFNLENHKGCVAIKSKIKYQNLQDIISFTVENGEIPLLLLLDGITDIRNIGALARTAYCCGVHAIVIPEKGVGALNEDAITTSAGALENMAVCRVKSLHNAIDELHLNGIKVFASEMTADVNVFGINFIEPCAIIMGSEDKGIQSSLYKACDNRFKIPMQKDFESLNVSVAAGMILYEAMKQRMIPAPQRTS
ncbi:MAG: 23S rRNA (guanosine(2251)-2'-O)-methyltransferase RlmB [Bacteroidota bacterium]|nr:23S rRNA (guanosine(2251)-2'-O)-methyltransferase RlmB [Bacteroidota bacterium]